MKNLFLPLQYSYVPRYKRANFQKKSVIFTVNMDRHTELFSSTPHDAASSLSQAFEKIFPYILHNTNFLFRRSSINYIVYSGKKNVETKQ